MTSARIAWPDYVKGVGIVLVCLNHVVSGLLNNAILAPGPAAAYLNVWFYTTMMTVFFFISGIFARGSARKPLGAFIADKLGTLAYPYFIWSAVQLLIMLALSGRTTHSAAWADLFLLPFLPVMHFWFLYTLLVLMGLFAALSKLGLEAGGVVLLAVGMKLLRPALPDEMWFVVHKACEYFIYFAAGAWLGPRLVERLPRIRTRRLAAAAAAGLGIYSLNVFFGWMLAEPLQLASGALTVVGFTALGVVLERLRAPFFLIRLGQASLAIYCGHTIGSAGVRIVLQGVFGVEAAAPHLALGVLGGVGFPLALWLAAERFSFPYLYRLPRRRRPARAALESA